MRAVVTQIQGKFAAILSEDGRIEKITNKNYVIGQVIEMKENVKAKKHIAAWVASAAAIVLVALGGTAYAYYSPYYYVSLDVNPSIEYTLNRFDRVLTAKAVNEDGTEILKEVDLKNLSNHTIDDAAIRRIFRITIRDRNLSISGSTGDHLYLLVCQINDCTHMYVLLPVIGLLSLFSTNLQSSHTSHKSAGLRK